MKDITFLLVKIHTYYVKRRNSRFFLTFLFLGFITGENSLRMCHIILSWFSWSPKKIFYLFLPSTLYFLLKGSMLEKNKMEFNLPGSIPHNHETIFALIGHHRLVSHSCIHGFPIHRTVWDWALKNKKII